MYVYVHTLKFVHIQSSLLDRLRQAEKWLHSFGMVSARLRGTSNSVPSIWSAVSDQVWGGSSEQVSVSPQALEGLQSSLKSKKRYEYEYISNLYFVFSYSYSIAELTWNYSMKKI